MNFNYKTLGMLWLLFMIQLSTISNSDAQALHWLSEPKSDVGSILNGQIFESRMSANGRFILFRSNATNVVNDSNLNFASLGNLYLYDRLLDTVKWVDQPFGNLDFFRITDFSAPTSDGSLMAFTYRGDIGFGTDRFDEHLYTKNLLTGEIKLISQDANGVPFEVSFRRFVLTDDGTQIVFSTRAQLVPEHTTTSENIYQVNLSSGDFNLISSSSDNTQAANSTTNNFTVSPSGRYVGFSSSADNLVNAIVIGSNLYLRDTTNETTTLVTVQSNGEPSIADETSFVGGVSNLGTVAFGSNKNDLVNDDNNQRYDLFLYNQGSNVRINLDAAGNELNNSNPSQIFINATGNLLYFSDSASYVNADGDDENDIYQYDILNGEFGLIRPEISDARLINNGISANGGLVLFTTFRSDESPNASLSNQLYGGLFVYDTTSDSVEQIEPVAFSPHTTLAGVTSPAMSSDQRYAVFTSTSPNLTEVAETEITTDAFYLDRLTDQSIQLGHLASAQAISPNGRYVVLSSFFFQPEGMINNGLNLYLYDTQNEIYSLIASGFDPEVNDLGLVVFTSNADLIPTDINGVTDIYLFDPNNNGINLISQNTSGEPGNAFSERAFLNNDPNNVSVVFLSDADDLIIGDINARRDVFIADWPSGSITRVSQTPALVGGNGFSYLADISNDGQTIGFVSFSNNLTNDPGTASANIYVYDRPTQNITLVSRDDTGAPLNSSPRTLSLSDAGNFISFNTERPLEFLGEDSGSNDSDVFLLDVNTEEIKLISQALDQSIDFIEGFSGRVYEDLSLSPPRVGVSFGADGRLTGLNNHPGYDEIYLYQQGGPNVVLDIEVIGAGNVGGSFGISCMTSCDYDYVLGTELNLVASPTAGYIFDRWVSSRGQCVDDTNPCLLTMDQDKQIQAIFIDSNEIIFTDGFE